MADIARIGRKPTATERTLQQIRERPELLEHMACNVFGAQHGLTGIGKAKAWERLSPKGRAEWESIVIERHTQAVAEGLP